MKANLRVPCKQPYAYIEAEVEGTAEEIVEAYFNLTETYQKKQDKKDQPKSDEELDKEFHCLGRRK